MLTCFRDSARCTDLLLFQPVYFSCAKRSQVSHLLVPEETTQSGAQSPRESLNVVLHGNTLRYFSRLTPCARSNSSCRSRLPVEQLASQYSGHLAKLYPQSVAQESSRWSSVQPIHRDAHLRVSPLQEMKRKRDFTPEARLPTVTSSRLFIGI